MNADVVVIGSGPAGIQAAMHSARKKVETVLIGKVSNSALYGAHIENYFGTGSVEGREMLEKGIEQVRSFGCRVIEQNVIGAEASSGGFTIRVESGEVIECRAIVLATGIARKKLNVPGENEFFGRGVSYCSACDCNFYKGAKVAVIGEESEAAVSADLMTRYASEVYWVAPKPDADKALVDRALAAGVKMIGSAPVEIKGSDKVTSLLLADGSEISVGGVFIELGGRSSADIAMDLGILPEIDDSVRTDDRGETSVKGVFACGDLAGRPWQVAKAVGEGAIAGAGAADHARSLR